MRPVKNLAHRLPAGPLGLPIDLDLLVTVILAKSGIPPVRPTSVVMVTLASHLAATATLLAWTWTSGEFSTSLAGLQGLCVADFGGLTRRI
jgi:hypothetical protein